MTITVATWNILNTNDSPENGVHHIMSLGADVICLQEIPAWFKRKLKKTKGKHGYRSYFAKDFKSEGVTYYLGILVRRGVKVLRRKRRRVRHEHGLSTTLLARRRDLTESIESLSVVISVGPKRLRIVNCHLPLNVPIATRHEELDYIAQKHFCGAPVIMGGDFNSCGHPAMNMTFGQMFGCRFEEVLIDEQELIEKFSRAHKMKRVLRGVVTFPHGFIPRVISNIPYLRDWRIVRGGQLDHILVRQDFKIMSCNVLDLFNSDHYPYFAIIRISSHTGT